jgi:hypothetical protein
MVTVLYVALFGIRSFAAGTIATIEPDEQPGVSPLGRLPAVASKLAGRVLRGEPRPADRR